MNRKVVTPLVAVLLVSCSGRDPDLAGHWKTEIAELQVSKEGDLYKVISNAEGSYNWPRGTFIGKYQDEAIKIGAPRCGDIAYSRNADKLYFCGKEFARIKN